MAALVAGPGGARVLVGTRRDGDFRPHSPGHLDRRRRLDPLAWTLLGEEHGTTVRVVESAGQWDGATGDALVTARTDAVLGLWVGDCAPVALLGDHVVAAVHCGWRGLRDGVLDRALDALGESPSVAVIGPRIGSCCNEFGPDDLVDMVDRFGPEVRTSDAHGRPSLDLLGCITVGLARRSRARVIDCGWCTRCRADLFWSHRRGDLERQGFAVRRVAA